MFHPLSDSYTEVKIYEWIPELKKFETKKNKQYINILEIVLFRAVNYHDHQNEDDFIYHTTIPGDTGDVYIDTVNTIQVYVPLIVDNYDLINKFVYKIQDICTNYINRKSKL